MKLTVSIFSYRLFKKTACLVLLLLTAQFSSAKQSFIDDTKVIKSISSMTFNEEDSISNEIERQIDMHLQEGDTSSGINLLNRLSMRYCNQVNYTKSYDGYWRALLLADQSRNEIAKAVSYNGLAILYSLYERRDAALKYYLLSLETNKSLVAKGVLPAEILVENYFPLAVHYKYEENYSKAKIYLDSCSIINPAQISNNGYVQSEYAHLMVSSGNFEEAEAIFSKIMNYEQLAEAGYAVILYSYMGDLYEAWGNLNKSEFYYKSSLSAANSQKTHLNFVPDVLQKIAKIKEAKLAYKVANDYLTLSHRIYHDLYSSRSPNNHYLLEIKDDFRLVRERNEQLAETRRLEQLEKQGEILELRIILLMLFLVFIITVGFFSFRSWRTRHKAEKVKMEQQRKLEEKQAREILTIKNKELTSSTLQLIAKDELLSDLKSKLKNIQNASNSKDVRRLIKDIDINKDQSWLLFENRFSAVHSDFYNELKTRFPSLKPYDLKICALVKLEFSGKEMARLLGISPESANTARYRLRKKLDLQRDDNLIDFLNSISS